MLSFWKRPSSGKPKLEHASNQEEKLRETDETKKKTEDHTSGLLQRTLR